MIGLKISTASLVRKSFLDPDTIPEHTPHDNDGASQLSLVRQNYPQAHWRFFEEERRGDKFAQKSFNSLYPCIRLIG